MKLNQMQPGDVVEVLVDRSSKDDVTRIFEKRLGHEILDIQSQTEFVTLLIKKREENETIS